VPNTLLNSAYVSKGKLNNTSILNQRYIFRANLFEHFSINYYGIDIFPISSDQRRLLVSAFIFGLKKIFLGNNFRVDIFGQFNNYYGITIFQQIPIRDDF